MPWQLHFAWREMARSNETHQRDITRMGPGNWEEKIDKFLLTQDITPAPPPTEASRDADGQETTVPVGPITPGIHPDTPLDSAKPESVFKLNDLVFAHNYAGYLM